MSLKVAMAQLNLLVGDINGNAQRVIEAAEHAKPKMLQLKLLHPTLADKDQSIILERTDDLAYSGIIAPVAPGAWNIIIESDSPAWRIQRRIDIDGVRVHYPLQ